MVPARVAGQLGSTKYLAPVWRDWGLGFIVNSIQYGAETVPYGYGHHASRRTFGHSGYRSSVAFGDPERGLAVALVFNGTPSNERHELRVRSVLDAVYEALGPV